MESAFNNVIEKISSYEIFNNIIPGVVYSVLTEKLTSFCIITENIFMTMVLFYFIGIVISRIGSIFSDVIGWCFNKLGWKPFLNFAPYSNYVKIENKDDKGRIRNLVAISNMYRTLASLSFCLVFTVLIDSVWPFVSPNKNYRKLFIIVFFVFLAILFLFSYRKQTNYITKRISCILESQSQES